MVLFIVFVAVAGILVLSPIQTARAFTSTSLPTTTTSSSLSMTSPDSITATAAEVFVPDTNEVIRSSLIALTLGGGLIPALISANGAMFSTLSGRKGYLKPGELPGKEVETYDNFNPNNTFDPTMGDPANQKYRDYVLSSGATGPVLQNSQFLFSADPIPLVDIVAVLGRIRQQSNTKDNDDTAAAVASICNWKDLPSTKRGEFSGSEPPMWLPRKSFKVLIRKNKFNGWPIDTKTGVPVGGEELKLAKEKRVSKSDAIIGDAALDAVFDSWSWGASIATPDKVTNTLKMIIKPVPGSSTNGVDLDAFIGAAIRGRSNTAIGAALFIVIQLVVFGAIFIGPLVKTLTGVDLFQWMNRKSINP